MDQLSTSSSTHHNPVLQISDILVTGAFIRKANLAEICEPHPARARAIAAFSMIFILIPLVLTALFITRVHIRGYVRRKQLQEMQKTLQGSATATQPFLGGSAAVDTSHLPDIYTANLAPPSTALHTLLTLTPFHVARLCKLFFQFGCGLSPRIASLPVFTVSSSVRTPGVVCMYE